MALFSIISGGGLAILALLAIGLALFVSMPQAHVGQFFSFMLTFAAIGFAMSALGIYELRQARSNSSQ